jgi:hypothetical protein
MLNSDDQQLIQKFQESRRQVTKIQVEYGAGKITREEVQARMREQMVLDDKNTWWSIGVETNYWYKFDDEDWIIAPLPVSIPAEEGLTKAIAEKRKYQPGFIDEIPIAFQFALPELQDPNKVQSQSLNSQFSDEDIRREAKEVFRKVLEEERQRKSQKTSSDQE